MIKVPIDLSDSESFSENITLEKNMNQKNKQILQSKLSYNIEPEKYSKSGVLLKGKLRFFSFRSFLIDLSIVVISNFLMNFLKHGNLTLESRTMKLLLLYLSGWLLISILYEKFNFNSYSNYIKGLLFIAKSWVAVVFLTINFLVLFGIYTLSRIQLFGMGLIHITLELMVFSIYFMTVGKEANKKSLQQKKAFKEVRYFSKKRIIFDFIAFIVSFSFINYLKHNSIELIVHNEGLLIIFGGLWFMSGIFTRKFEIKQYRNIYYKMSPFIKSFLIHFSLMTVFLYAFRLHFLPRFQVLGSITLLLLFELLAIFVRNLYVFAKGQNGDINSHLEINEIFQQQKSQPIIFKTKLKKFLHLETSKQVLKAYLKNDESLYRFIKKHIELRSLDQRTIKVLNTKNPFNIQTLDDHSLNLFVNLHKINDFRYLNRYFLIVHQKIHNTGFLVGTAHTISTHKERFNSKFPYFMANVLYPFDFIYRRVLPKLPKIRKLYFFLTKGKDRIISETEILGRLCFCGFKIIAREEVDNRLYFIAQRIQNPSVDKNPSYSPIIKLPRVGLDGKIIYIRKFRTMYPFSEYIQNFVFEKNKLNSNGKFDNDFRITEWGRWFRKLWIDELPQIINFWQGDIGLVGVRPLSEQYFSLYPDDLKELRTKFKPGLIPPYYVDLPKSFNEIIDSERNYLKQKIKHYLSTDIKYFFKATYNILFKHARSQ